MARFLLQCSIPLKNVAVSHKKVSELGIKCHTFSKEAYSSYNFVVHQILWKRKNERADARRWRIKRWFCSRLFIGLWSKCKQMCCAPSLQIILVFAFQWLIVQRQYVIIYIPTTSWAVIVIPFSNHIRVEVSSAFRVLYRWYGSYDKSSQQGGSYFISSPLLQRWTIELYAYYSSPSTPALLHWNGLLVTKHFYC